MDSDSEDGGKDSREKESDSMDWRRTQVFYNHNFFSFSFFCCLVSEKKRLERHSHACKPDIGI